MLPPPVPTLANAGIVVSALLGGVKRSPRTLMRPPAGVSNSIVPRWFAVTGNCVDRPRIGSVDRPPIVDSGPERDLCTGVVANDYLQMTCVCAEMLVTATPSTTPSVLSKGQQIGTRVAGFEGHHGFLL